MPRGKKSPLLCTLQCHSVSRMGHLRVAIALLGATVGLAAASLEDARDAFVSVEIGASPTTAHLVLPLAPGEWFCLPLLLTEICACAQS
jgi:hypothetical protein